VISPQLLAQTVTWVQPAYAPDPWGNANQVDWTHATSTDIPAWITQITPAEVVTGSRDVIVGQWQLITNELGIGPRDRIEYDGATYEVTGPPAIAETPSGPHHLIAHLTRTEG
jgi:hypothetical protein